MAYSAQENLNSPNPMYGAPTPGPSRLAAERPLEMFQNATNFGVEGSQFVNVRGDMHIHPAMAHIVAPAHEQPVPGAPPWPGAPHAADACSETELYCSQLWRRQRGFPLFVPAPQRNLPDAYRINGVSIGDVGMVTPEGIWDFFFNVFLPAEHPINANNVPDGFVPLERYGAGDVLLHDFDAGSYVTSASVQVRGNDGDFQVYPGGGFVFSCRGPHGAVLALPSGSHLIKLARRQEQIRRYAAENAQSWYRYINGTIGRCMVNGELYLITGCEKCVAGGMATFQNIAAGDDFNLAFKRYPTPSSRYRFSQTPAQTKTFAAQGGERNNTVFLHGFTISIGEGIWGALWRSVGISQITESESPARKAPGGYIPFGSQGFMSSFWSHLPGGGGSGGRQNRDAPPNWEGVTLNELSPAPKIVHPSRIINEHILQMVPHATSVITHDDDWCDVLWDEATQNGATSDASQWIKRIFERFEIGEEGGSVYLMAKDELTPISNYENFEIMDEDAELGSTPISNHVYGVARIPPTPRIKNVSLKIAKTVRFDPTITLYEANHNMSVQDDATDMPGITGIPPSPQSKSRRNHSLKKAKTVMFDIPPLSPVDGTTTSYGDEKDANRTIITTMSLKDEVISLSWPLVQVNRRSRSGRPLVYFDLGFDPRLEENLKDNRVGGGFTALRLEDRELSVSTHCILREMVLDCPYIGRVPVRRAAGLRCIDIFAAIYDAYRRKVMRHEMPSDADGSYMRCFRQRCKDSLGATEVELLAGMRRVDLLKGRRIFDGLARAGENWALIID